jgi:hypothetical protein
MKSQNLISLLLVIITATFYACNSLTECDHIIDREGILLIDVSDKKLYADIENDLKTNFPGFMERTGLGNISPCQNFKLSFAHLSGKEALDLSSQSIGIARKGQSRKEEKRQADPAPLVQLMAKKINDYKQLTEDAQMTAGSNIANVLLKTIIQSNADAETTILLFSDMVENNPQLNLYKKIPSAEDVHGVIEKLIEPAVLTKFKTLKEEGLETKVIIVMKSEPNGKTNQRNVKNFWIEVFRELKLNVQFIDNLSNSVVL